MVRLSMTVAALVAGLTLSASTLGAEEAAYTDISLLLGAEMPEVSAEANCP